MAGILFVNLEGRIGGAETSLLLMAKHLRDQCVISVACPAESPLSRALAAMRVDFYGIPGPPDRAYSSPLSLVYWLKTSWRLIRIVLRVNPDLIHANSFYAAAPSALAALVTRRKLLSHARDLANFGVFSRLYGYFCERIIAVSHAVRNALMEQGVSPDKIKVVYNGVDDGFFSPSDESNSSLSALGAHRRHSFVFAHVGQFVPWKNHIVFLEAASQVARDLCDVRFVLVGDDIFGRNSAYKRSVLSYAEKSTIAERVDFLGWQANMHEVWPRINCLVHTAEREPFGRVIIEAMAHRIPVIAVDSCGPSEIIQDRKTGVLVQANGIQELSEAMVKMAQDTRFAGRLANAGYEHVISSFAADKTASLIQQIYQEVLAT